MADQSKKKHKKNKMNEVSDAGISETELEGNGVGVEGCERLDKEDLKERKNDKGRKKEKDNPKKKKVIEDSCKGIVERKKTDEQEQVKELVIMEDQAGNVNEKLGNKKKKRGKDNGHLNASNICDDLHQQDKEVETVGFMESQNGEHLEESKSDDGHKRNFIDELGKKKKKRKKGKEIDAQSAAREGILAKKNNPMRADSTMDEEQDKNMGILNA